MLKKEKSQVRRAPYIVVLGDGDKGVGKTTMLANVPGLLLLDIEGRAGHVSSLRWDYTPEDDTALDAHGMCRAVRDSVLWISSLQFRDGGYWHDGTQIKAIGVDTLDAFYDYCLKAAQWHGVDGRGTLPNRDFVPAPRPGAEFRDSRALYGTATEFAFKFLLEPLAAIKVPVVFAVHVRERGREVPWKLQDQVISEIPEVSASLPASVSKYIYQRADLVLHLLHEPTQAENGRLVMQRTALTAPSIINGVFCAAKDSLNIFNGARISFSIEGRNGSPVIVGPNPIVTFMQKTSISVEAAQAASVAEVISKRKAAAVAVIKALGLDPKNQSIVDAMKNIAWETVTEEQIEAVVNEAIKDIKA